MENKVHIATFAEGCFWGVEETFRKIEGVSDVVVGYTGGTSENPTYEEVCSGKTGHAEAVEVTFDPEIVSYRDLLKIFWESHNPTTPNQQGPDIGSQYRSVIFYHSPDQQKEATDSKEKIETSRKYTAPIVTEILPVGLFFKAEEYHQRYFEKQGR